MAIRSHYLRVRVMIIEYSARSHVGWVREKNEDNLYVDGITLLPEDSKRTFAISGSKLPPAIFAVCDGMGGEEKGEVASLYAVQVLSDMSGQIKSTIPRFRRPKKNKAFLAASRRLDETIQSYVQKAIETIRSDYNNTGRRVGTTLAMTIIAENGIYCFNMGDSRIYCLQEPTFWQVTNDHTLISEKIRNGALTPDQIKEYQENNDKANNKLTRCMGIGGVFSAEGYKAIYGNCRILICSDGLTDMVNEAGIENVMNNSNRAADAADALLGMALDNGGEDNVTVIVADVKGAKGVKVS